MAAKPIHTIMWRNVQRLRRSAQQFRQLACDDFATCEAALKSPDRAPSKARLRSTQSRLREAGVSEHDIFTLTISCHAVFLFGRRNQIRTSQYFARCTRLYWSAAMPDVSRTLSAIQAAIDQAWASGRADIAVKLEKIAQRLEQSHQNKPQRA